jgi:hypothetical protein
MSIAERLRDVRQRIAEAAESVDRDPGSVRLVAISKTFPTGAIREAFDAGQRDFGENKVQEALPKIEQLRDLPITWHLVGHLQTNKSKKAASAFSLIQSVDSGELLQKIDRAAHEAGRAPELLIQVDLAEEATKSGAQPDAVPSILDLASTCRAARVVGLMTLPPLPEQPDDARPWFRRLRELRNRLLDARVPPDMLRELSMGMSGDFQVAIEEGATIVRVGTAIFGPRGGHEP